MRICLPQTWTFGEIPEIGLLDLEVYINWIKKSEIGPHHGRSKDHANQHECAK